jgi:hypothetical protein
MVELILTIICDKLMSINIKLDNKQNKNKNISAEVVGI